MRKKNRDKLHTIELQLFGDEIEAFYFFLYPFARGEGIRPAKINPDAYARAEVQIGEAFGRAIDRPECRPGEPPTVSGGAYSNFR
jgi:hypothetical protein